MSRLNSWRISPGQSASEEQQEGGRLVERVGLVGLPKTDPGNRCDRAGSDGGGGVDHGIEVGRDLREIQPRNEDDDQRYQRQRRAQGEQEKGEQPTNRLGFGLGLRNRTGGDRLRRHGSRGRLVASDFCQMKGEEACTRAIPAPGAIGGVWRPSPLGAPT